MGTQCAGCLQLLWCGPRRPGVAQRPGKPRRCSTEHQSIPEPKYRESLSHGHACRVRVTHDMGLPRMCTRNRATRKSGNGEFAPDTATVSVWLHGKPPGPRSLGDVRGGTVSCEAFSLHSRKAWTQSTLALLLHHTQRSRHKHRVPIDVCFLLILIQTFLFRSDHAATTPHVRFDVMTILQYVDPYGNVNGAAADPGLVVVAALVQVGIRPSQKPRTAYR